jgi:magnesium-transporting ATPase (P-type)
MAAVIDQPNPYLVDAIQKAEQARIRLFIVTGDHPSTAEALAHQIKFSGQPSPASSAAFGSIESLDTSATSFEMSESLSCNAAATQNVPVIHGDRLGDMSDQEWTSVLKNRRIIFARTSPMHKTELIKVLFTMELNKTKFLAMPSLKLCGYTHRQWTWRC